MVRPPGPRETSGGDGGILRRMFSWLLACSAPSPETVVAPAPSIAATGAPATAAPTVASTEVGSLSVVATGDLLLHKAVQETASTRGSYDVLFDAVAPTIRMADVAFANLETPIAPKSGKPVAPLEFNAPPELLASLVSTGFDVVSFANNHVYDQGRPGLVETLEHLDAAKLAYVGAGRTCAEAAAPRTITHNGVTVSFLGTSQVYNDRLNAGVDEPCADTFDAARIVAGARAAKADGADVVILSVHWGVEYATAPNEGQVATAHELVEGGVDVLLGHHPHVLAPIEVVHTEDGRTGIIAYSLGNFVSNQSAWYEPGLNPPATANPRDGVMLSFRVVKREYGTGERKVVHTALADLSATPLWTRNAGTGDGTADIAVVALPTRIEELRKQLAAATTDAEVVTAGTELDEMERRWKQVGKILGEQFLAERAP